VVRSTASDLTNSTEIRRRHGTIKQKMSKGRTRRQGWQGLDMPEERVNECFGKRGWNGLQTDDVRSHSSKETAKHQTNARQKTEEGKQRCEVDHASFFQVPVNSARGFCRVGCDSSCRILDRTPL
jgi:hypothetical protein